MTDKYNDEIIEEENQDTDDQTDDYEPEKFCTLCHRSERQAGKMIDLPNNIHICPDCMQRSFDSMNTQMQSGNFNYGDLFNMPNISMIDLSSFQNQMGQQPKPKKKKSEKKAPVLDLKKIPAPHKSMRKRLCLLPFIIIINVLRPIQWMRSQSRNPIC